MDELARCTAVGRLSCSVRILLPTPAAACRATSFPLLTFEPVAWGRARTGQIHCDMTVKGPAK